MLKIKNSISRKLKWGVVGCGRFTEGAFLPAINILRKAKVNSVFSHDIKRAKFLSNKNSIQNYFSNYQEFLKSDIEAVYIASANSNHYYQTIEAAKTGKHILCEKPLSINSNQAVEMVKICKDNGVQFAVNYVYRFHPLIKKAKEIIESNLLGKLILIKADFLINFFPSDNFRFNKQLSGGGAFRDLGTHIIDLMRFFGGEIKSISGFVDNIVYKSDVDDFASCNIQFEKSGYGVFNVGYNAYKSFNRIEIIGHKGSLSIDSLINSRFPSSAKLTIQIEGEAKKAFRKRANKLYRMIKSVNKSFLKNEKPEVTGEDGLINMKLMEEFESKCSTEKN